MSSVRDAIIAEFHENMTALQRQLSLKCGFGVHKGLPSRAQMSVLFIVSRSEAAVGIKEIAERLCMTSSAATQLVDGLADEGLLRRREGGGDRRKTELSLTAKGRKKVEFCMKMRLKLFTKLLSPLSDAELRTFKKLQQKILLSFRRS